MSRFIVKEGEPSIDGTSTQLQPYLVPSTCHRGRMFSRCLKRPFGLTL